MTSISAKPPGDMPRPAQPERPLGDDRSGAGESFGDTLLAMLDRALMTPVDDQPSATLPGGTMRSNVEVFNEHGFFDRNATIVASALPPVDAPTAMVPPPIAPPAALAGTVTHAAPTAADAPGSLSASHASDFPVPLDTHQPLASARPRPLIRPARAGSVIVRPLTASIAGLDDGEATQVAHAAAKRAAAAPQSASRLRVTLDHGEAGVAVSVTTDVDQADDHSGIRDAVSQMLARHGLVLSELRVTRRPDSDQGRG